MKKKEQPCIIFCRPRFENIKIYCLNQWVKVKQQSPPEKKIQRRSIILPQTSIETTAEGIKVGRTTWLVGNRWNSFPFTGPSGGTYFTDFPRGLWYGRLKQLFNCELSSKQDARYICFEKYLGLVWNWLSVTCGCDWQYITIEWISGQHACRCVYCSDVLHVFPSILSQRCYNLSEKL